ncbi:unnamed protein product [Caenorhabditis brenneri]
MRYIVTGSILSVLLAGVLASDNAETDYKRRKDCVDSENKHRKSYAEMMKIGNMMKLDYDIEIENIRPMNGFKCPMSELEPEKYSDGYWAVVTRKEATAEAVLATKMACIPHEKCGLIYVINQQPDYRNGKTGKPGSACSGAVENGLCVGKTGTSSLEENRRKSCVDSENKHRKEFAEMHKIGNMAKLEYDAELEKIKPMGEFKCPMSAMLPKKYSDGYWAVVPREEATAEAILATKMACIHHEKCGLIYVINNEPDYRKRKEGKPGSKCDGKTEDGLCV